MATVNLNQNQLHNLLNEGKTILVDFWAPWCVYCRRIGPALESFAQEHPELTVAKVNIDEEPLLANLERIEVIPTLVMYKGGKAISSIVAPESKAMIDRFIAESLEK